MRLPRPRDLAQDGVAFDVEGPEPPQDQPPPAGASGSDDAITNTQVAGVDEGGIVKVAGERLIVLRRGHLFTISLAGGVMRAIASIDAFPPGVDGSDDWYDEMLVAGDRVIVIGYSYSRGGTEVNRFRLVPDGSLRFEDSTHLRSNDYYSSRNYASRLTGTRLIYYTPLYPFAGRTPTDKLPAIRRWGLGAGARWEPIVDASRVFVPQRLRRERRDVDTAHSVVSCDLAAPALDCKATVVLGAGSRTFFVSSDAVYVWTTFWDDDPRRARPGLLYRLPLNPTRRPQALGVRGAPIDQFSFAPDEARGALNVVVRAEGEGDATWAAEAPDGGLALARIPLRAFGDGARELPRPAYQPLPPVEGWRVQNRFVGDHLLYGSSEQRVAMVVGVGDRRVTRIPLPHAVDRLDRMGADAIVVGEDDGALGFSTVTLGPVPARADTFRLPAAAETESRSHGFFFRGDTPDGASGLLGLPISRERPDGDSAALQFLTRADRRLSDAGALAAAGVAGDDADDGCVASCVDWYGNARPIFWRGRVFALMGYELVEGAVRDGRIREVARLDFAPRKARR